MNENIRNTYDLQAQTVLSTLTASQIKVECYLASRCRPSEAEYTQTTLERIINANGDAAKLADVLEQIPMGKTRQQEKDCKEKLKAYGLTDEDLCGLTDEELWKKLLKAWIKEASQIEQGRQTNCFELYDAVRKEDNPSIERIENLLNAMKKTPEGKRKPPTGIGFSSHAIGPSEAGIILLDIDFDLDSEKTAKKETLSKKENYKKRLEANPFVIKTWDSRRGYGIHGLFVCAEDPASVEAATEYIQKQFPEHDANALRQKHTFIALPGHDLGLRSIYKASEEQQEAYKQKQKAIMENRANIAKYAGDDREKYREKYLAKYLTEWLPKDCQEHLDHAGMVKVATRCGNFLRSGYDTAQSTILQCAEVIRKGTDGHETIREIARQIEWGIDYGNNDPIADLIIKWQESNRRGKKNETAAKTAANSNSKKLEANDNATEKLKKTQARDIARDWFDGYTFDSFKNKLHKPDGQTITLDDAAAELCRTNNQISLNMATEAGIIWVRNNPARHFDSLEKRVKELAAGFTTADAGAIERYADRCGYDGYERRRLYLWLCQVCARSVIRGEKTDGMLVLAGRDEGTKKSTFFNAVATCLTGAGAAEFKFKQGADGDLLLASTPVVVIDELDKYTSGKIDVAELKTRITQQGSKVRAPYDRDAKERANAAVFGATTNEEAPIPASEGEARRYWVLHPTRSVQFTGTPEVESVMREAAHDTLAELEAHKAEYDPLTTIGKIWVQSEDEERETSERNRAFKIDDAPTLAIQAALNAIANYQSNLFDSVYPIGAIAIAAETGSGQPLKLNTSWEAPRTNAQAVSRMIKARGGKPLYRTHRDPSGKVIKGCKISELAAEFCPDLHAKFTTNYQTFDDHFDDQF